MKCSICELTGKSNVLEEAEYIINGFSVCKRHFDRWAEGTMSFKIDNEPQEYEDKE